MQSGKVVPGSITSAGLRDCHPGGVVIVYALDPQNREIRRPVFTLSQSSAPRRVWGGDLEGPEEWMQVQTVVGRLVYDHAGFVGPPDWRSYPVGSNRAEPAPAVLKYVMGPDRRLTLAKLWWGEPGQDPAAFLVEVDSGLRTE